MVLRRFVRGHALGGGLVLSGGPGIGKTTLWEMGIAEASSRGIQVLSVRASSAEAKLAFAGLIDLLDGVDLRAIPGLPPPQLRALEVALLRAEPGGAGPEPRAIALGLLNTLRTLAEPRLLVAIDDLQSLDDASSEALSFAARRLEGAGVGFLVTTRPGPISGVEDALAPRSERLEVGPLSLGAIRLLLSERLDLHPPRRVLRRIVDATLGNPLFALEFGRALVASGSPGLGDDIPVPDTVEDLLGTRVAGLAPPLRRLLLAVALADRLPAAQLVELTSAEAVEDAVESGLLVVDEEEEARVSHPLLEAAVRKAARPRERRAVHRELAHLAGDGELRVLHLARAAAGPDAALAGELAAAGAAAHARGAVDASIELAEQALRLTPPGARDRVDRLLELAEFLEVAGEVTRMTGLLAPEVEGFPPGSARARARLLLASEASHADDIEAHLRAALGESESEPELRARLLSMLATDVAVGRVERLDQCQAWAEEALALVETGGGDATVGAVEALAWIRLLRGQRLDRLSANSRSLALETEIYLSLDRIAAIQLAFRGEMGPARAIFERLLALADERGEMWSFLSLRLQLCELELRAGRWAAAEGFLDDWEAAVGITFEPARRRCLALLAAGRGDSAEAEHQAAAAVALEQAAGVRWSHLEALRARGIARILAGDPAGAADALRPVWEHVRREGVADPGAFPFAPELVEALLDLGEADEARAVSGWLSALAEEQQHPWGLAAAARCAGLVSLVAHGEERGAEMLAKAAQAYAELGLGFDRARTLLLLGRCRRRRRRWAAAREALEAAAGAFDDLGSPGWADATRAELTHVGGRQPAPRGSLTSSERRAADLAAQGLSNKEIAAVLHVAVGTVEVHLARAYAKLGVRRRAQLASRLADLD